MTRRGRRRLSRWQRTGPARQLLAGGLLLAAGLLLLGYLTPRELADLRAYRAAPGCAGAPRPGCRATVTVTVAERDPGERGRGGHRPWVVVEPDRAADVPARARQVEVPWSRIGGMAVGLRVEAEVWRGRIVRVGTPAGSFDTPEAPKRGVLQLAVLGGVATAWGALCLVTARTWRSLGGPRAVRNAEAVREHLEQLARRRDRRGGTYRAAATAGAGVIGAFGGVALGFVHPAVVGGAALVGAVATRIWLAPRRPTRG